jgi:protocatechuate 3,4-dioxygenase beta subunit
MLRLMTDHDATGDDDRRGLRRREALAALGLSAGALGAGSVGRLVRAEQADAATSCVRSPEVTEGPYWIENSLTGRDITAGQKGLGLRLAITVVNARSCAVIRGADVEIWHANALGEYSGVEGNAGRYLRGRQRTNASGVATFDTIYPGWYRGRTPHIHVKVHVGGDSIHTGQIFFVDSTSARVYRTSRYRSHGSSADTTNAEDSIYREAGAARARARLTERSSGGYRGTITLGVAT